MNFEPIAIVGRGCVFPGALTPDELWQNIAAGRDTTASAPDLRWRVPKHLVTSTDPAPGLTPTDRGGYVTGFEGVFQPDGFALPWEQLAHLDVSAHWVLHTAREALRDAGLGLAQVPHNAGLVLGALALPTESFAEYAESVWLRADRPEHAVNRFHPGLAAELVARALHLRPDAFALDAACASSLYAIKLACDQLHQGTRDLMLAGAVSRADDLFLHLGFASLRAISLTGQSRPFHAHADGLLPAEGAGIVVLKRLADARRDGNRIYAVIRGIGLSNDGRTAGLLTPSAEGQERAIRSAYLQAALDPSQVSLIECHATGTPIGDATEIRSTARLFQNARAVPIGSVKSNLGHPLTAAGMAGLIKLMGAMAAATRPRTLHLASLDARLPDIESSPFRLLTENEPWESSGPRVAALNGFGFGGNNAHLLLEEWAGQEYRRSAASCETPTRETPRVAITAIGITAGSARGVEQFTRDLFFGTPANRRIDQISLRFDTLGFPPNDLRAGLPQQALALEAANEAIARAGLLSTSIDRARIAVFAGAECDPEAARVGLRTRRLSGRGHFAEESGIPNWSAAGVTGRLTNMVANRISSAHDFRGPSLMLAQEELSGFAALHLACRALRAREIDAAVVGAVDLSCEPVHEAAIRALRPDPPPPGDAAVFFVLQRLDEAPQILAEVDPPGAATTGESFGDNQPLAASSPFGRPHAATGLLEAAAATLACSHGSLFPARPWISGGQRTANVSITTTAGTNGAITLASHPTQPPKPLLSPSTPRLIVCCAADRHSLKSALADAWHTPPTGTRGPMRLAIVAATESDWRRKHDRALEILDSGVSTFSSDGIHFREAPLPGELAFVFPGGASSYAGMARTLLAAFPDVALNLLDNAPKTRPSLEWLFASQSKPAGPGEKLAGSIFLSQFHARLTRSLLELQPSAAIGMSAGETSALLAFDIWRNADTFFQEFIQSGVFDRYLAGRYEVVNGTPWESWGLLLPEPELQTLLRDEPSLRLLAIHAPGEYLIAGDSPTCARAVARAGKAAAQPVDFPAVIHCPDLAPFSDRWRQLHHRETWPVPSGLRIYGMAAGRPYEVNRDTAADALTAQALTTLDYPRVIRQAWDDGVRIFLEHGARGSCTSWIRRILSGREHLAIALDSPITDSLTQTIDAVAQLAVAGVPMNLPAFLDRIAVDTRSLEEPARLLLPAHAPPVVLPAEPPPPPPPAPKPAPAILPAPAPAILPASASTSPAALDLFRRHAEQLSARQAEFAGVALAAHRKFLDTSQRALQQFLANGGHTASVPVALPTPAPPPPKAKPLIWDRAQLEITATGRISTIYGKQFEALDTYAKIVRLPMPPMLLVDRVTHIEGEPASMGLGRIVTETDVVPTSWYLLQQRIPAGLMIEAGQADMLLISWLGIDFHLRGERVYRMLGCQVTFHGPLAMPGDTLRYEIRINGHARQGGIRLFFFEYDCYIGTRLVLSVRKGQAGFFSDKELATSTGVLWDPRTTPPAANARGPEPSLTAPRSYSAQQVLDAAQGRVFECFGKGFELAAAQQRPPVFSNPDLLQFDTITELNFNGGPWRRGYVRAESIVKPDSFLFTSHFKDDPCLPGTVMLEGSYQLMAFYMMAMGLTLPRDGWRFEPLTGEELTVSCRGQVLPSSRQLISELFIDEFHDGEEPVLIADTLGTVDGQRAFHGHRLGLRLRRTHLLDTPSALAPLPTVLPGQRPAASVNGILLDEHAMLHTAWGLPSQAFGPPYARFDSSQRCPRLPGPPYLFMSRITSLTGEFGAEQAGGAVEAEYAVRADDWYFSSNSHPEMPYSVLLEVALQPCGWLSCFTGIPIHRDEELFFRNLDGAAAQRIPVPARDAIITTRASLRSLSKFGSITLVSFDVHLRLGDQPLLDLNTSFGFFSKADLLGQTGLPPTPAEIARFREPSAFYCDLRPAPARYFDGPLRLASGRLLMIDEITGLWTGPDGPARIRARKNLHPTDWFFKAHFYQDPVQPGSLGLEALVQTLQFFAIHQGFGDLTHSPRFELQKDSTWKYRGQAIPLNATVETEVVIHDILRSSGRVTLVAEGWLWVDGLRVYHFSKFSIAVR